MTQRQPAAPTRGDMSRPEVAALKREASDVLLTNILPFWLGRMPDRERGGFYGRIDGEGRLHPEAERGAILNARILWAMAAAHRVTGSEACLEAALRAKAYIIGHFVDPDYGGVYWSVDAEGRPLDTKKQFYAIGFALYGMSELARATGDAEAMRLAAGLYRTIERHAVDPTHGGYIEAATRTWEPIGDMRLSELDANYPKSQNTHLHIIEPYANLYRLISERPELARQCGGAGLEADVRRSLSGLIDIFCQRILNPSTHHLDLFFEMDWTRGAGWIESYGHDIECSWLMHEAALVLGDADVLARVEPIVRLVAQASEKGLNADGSMTHEANLDTGHVDADRHWWVQAEAVVGFFNLYQHFGDESALQKALACWSYIKQNLIDREGGEWYWSRDPEGHINRKDDKAGFWKCPYHNSRMCLEIIERS